MGITDFSPPSNSIASAINFVERQATGLLWIAADITLGRGS
jgi:hypothetical protein